MDLTIPHTLYPSALPAAIAWCLFLAAVVGASAASAMFVRAKRPVVAAVVFFPVLLALLVFSVIVSVVITFFLHDI